MDVGKVVQEHLVEKEMQGKEELEAARRAEVREAAREFGERWGSYMTRDASDLPAGMQGDPETCVFANLLGGVWNGSTWRPTAESHMEIGLPDEVQEFIHRFDAGEYPDLVQINDLWSEDGD